MKNSYFRPEIESMQGYAPGEQPKLSNLCKLNTNENPYPPSPQVNLLLNRFDPASLRRYPDPMADAFCLAVAQRWGAAREQVIAGNGSDDLLTMIFRAFTAPDKALVCPEPTYSLYPVLAQMQGAPVWRVLLDAQNDFALPGDFLAQCAGANLLAMARPNAPTGNSFPHETMREIVAGFDGIVLIDEAYADFAEDTCMELVKEFGNVIVTRTFSKSYSLAGLRLGYAVSSPEIIAGLAKLKDSYNLDRLTQEIGLCAFGDTAYLEKNCRQVKRDRDALSVELGKLGFRVIPSQTNFVFAAPPDGDGERFFSELRRRAIIVRYFAQPSTKNFVRITIGTPAEMARLVDAARELYA